MPADVEDVADGVGALLVGEGLSVAFFAGRLVVPDEAGGLVVVALGATEVGGAEALVGVGFGLVVVLGVTAGLPEVGLDEADADGSAVLVDVAEGLGDTAALAGMPAVGSSTRAPAAQAATDRIEYRNQWCIDVPHR